ncbi:DNA polymerase family B domain-containing protein [Hirsutella rhossiliensis]|uniref:DNA polymerase n=1 Tax=Hirsutella rhossiliensis TaxID=111463 RepID=A0A9P8MSW5_9HYPO|nr:DNA polymerase family B domain-containing protein [Hirsutella rhossiliensis]KAH0960564.1 DNA polymerase family B domain-containing protein [Hirsutella rhossiliensis]
MSKINRRAKMAELQALRQSGKKTFDNYRVDEAHNLYDEVDEDNYKKIVRTRLNQDDFVVDDNGEGYADDGREEWDRVHQYDSDSEADDLPARGRPSKAAQESRKEEQARRAANDRNISEYFTKGAAKSQPKPKVVKTKAESDFMAGLLDEVDCNPHSPAPAPKRSKPEGPGQPRKSRALSPAPEPMHKRQKRVDTRSSSPPAPSNRDSDDGFLQPMVDDEPLCTNDAFMSDPAPSSPAAKVAQRKAQMKQESQKPQEPQDDDDDDMMEIAHAGTAKTSSVNIAGSRPVQKVAKPDPYPSPASSSPPKPAPENAIDPASWNDLTERLNVDAVEADGSLNFFWTDYVEINGSLCLFGKVLDKKLKSYVSCFVKVDNILRKLYFLPRPRRVHDGEESGEEVEMTDVYGEVDDMMTKMNVGIYKIKKCFRKYAFELPDVPQEAEYLKLLYPYTKPQIDMNAKGETFSHVFGTNTALFEQFVLWKNIMGPCWLKIQDADFGAIKNASHCKLEVLAEHPDMVSTASETDNLDCPPLTLMSVALRTAFNAQENKQEIVAISARIYDKVQLSDTTPVEEMACRTFTVIRPHGQGFPLGFEQLAMKRKRGLIALKKQESDLLSFFLAQIDVADPDVILGHQLEGVDYSILLNRLYEKKTHQWSRLGRFRRTQWPPSLGKAGSNVFAERQVMAGRLLCDIANDAGKSAMYKCQSWSLTEMCSLYLSGDNRRRDIDNDVALNTWAKQKQGLMDYIAHVEADTHYITALALGVQLLSLTKVLTNLAGNSWARTLTGTRAERNEFILLHEFHRSKYICPDKQTFRGRQKPEDEKQEEEGVEGKKKDKYKGGLVFEPQKGLYDKFVLVMDFNSLYPSIIQEFNICFTTVDRTASTEDEDAVPMARTSQDQGILPKLIATLVSRRRQVKSLMKDRTATPEKLATWDIKQLALKLTANSMYGCLGYTKSRFYARQLAVLTTYKGREILCSTKELAESKSLQVIYGDTDSVMINANVNTVADALKVGNEFKKAVNDQYKLLEIDIDAVFRRILLQAKKKYAAISLVQKDGKFIENMEVKGLDMRRREYCALSKEISKHLLDEILSGEETEVAIARIHEYLRETAGKMREQTIPTAKYIIYTQLGKGPKEYPNADSMPQVQVALRDIARGKTVRKGDVISYIITGDNKSSEPAPKRAYAPSDLKTDASLQPDVEWYIGKQIFPPVERLCANIAGTSTSQLAEQLGLSIRRHTSHQTQQDGSSNDMEIHPLESQIPDDVRFSDCARLFLQCRKCKASSTFEGLAASPDRVSASGVLCAGCRTVIPSLSVVAQVEHAIRTQTALYYEGWLICDDAQCGNRTRQMSVYGTRCLGPKGLARDCLGRMRYEYTEKAIYNQLLYFASLWDVDKARSRADNADGELSREHREKILALAEHNRVRFGTAKGVVDKYLDKCGRQWVAMDTLFAKLGFNKMFAAS